MLATAEKHVRYHVNQSLSTKCRQKSWFKYKKIALFLKLKLTGSGEVCFQRNQKCVLIVLDSCFRRNGKFCYILIKTVLTSVFGFKSVRFELKNNLPGNLLRDFLIAQRLHSKGSPAGCGTSNFAGIPKHFHQGHLSINYPHISMKATICD